MEMGGKKVSWAGLLSCILVPTMGFVVLISMILLSRTPLTYDEPWHLETVPLLQEKGLSADFLRSLPGPAGPLFSVVQGLFAPLTHLQPPGVRLVSAASLAALVAAVFLILLSRNDSPQPWSMALCVLCIPILWRWAGLALTELPPLVFLAGFLACMLNLDQAGPRSRQLALAITGGLCLGIATLGRQPSLVAIGALPLLWRDRRSVLPLAMTVLSSALLVLPVFYTWGGIVPPRMNLIPAGINPGFGMLSFAYGAVLVLLLAPRYFVLSAPLIVISILTGAALHWFIWEPSLVPLYSAAHRYLSPGLVNVYARLANTLMIAAGVLLIISILVRAAQDRKDRSALFMSAACLLLLATPARVTHLFSPRYVSVAVPCLVYLTAPWSPPTFCKAIRLTVGVILGALSLWSFLVIGRGS